MGKNGERGRNRTYNLLIKSQLLCQLSYAPGIWNETGRAEAEYSISAALSDPEPARFGIRIAVEDLIRMPLRQRHSRLACVEATLR
jgi:hypothetical protein